MEKQDMKVVLGAVAVVAVALALPQEALAFATPEVGAFAFDIYDIGVNKILKGPIGFVTGVGGVVAGAFFAFQGKVLQGVPVILASAGVLKADTIVNSLGMIF